MQGSQDLESWREGVKNIVIWDDFVIYASLNYKKFHFKESTTNGIRAAKGQMKLGCGKVGGNFQPLSVILSLMLLILYETYDMRNWTYFRVGITIESV